MDERDYEMTEQDYRDMERDYDDMYADRLEEPAWSGQYEEYEPFRDDVEADADTLRSAGYGTDEDYGYFGEDSLD